MRPFLPVLFLSALLLLAARAPVTASSAEAPLAPGSYRWLEDGPWGGPLYMVISIERQMVHVYSGDRLIGMARVSTGRAGHRTPTGAFPILQKRQWHRSNIYSNAPMPFMQRLTWDGIALHAGHDPGYPASHGCIRLPYAFARQLFALTQIGTLVEVTTGRLSAALKLDPLVLLDDRGTTVVTFTPRTGPPPRQQPAPVLHDEEDVPMLEIDPAIFGTWKRTGRSVAGPAVYSSSMMRAAMPPAPLPR